MRYIKLFHWISALLWAGFATIPSDAGAALPPHVAGELLVKFREGPRGVSGITFRSGFVQRKPDDDTHNIVFLDHFE